MSELLKSIKCGVNELKFIQNFDDLKLCIDHKLPFLLSRLVYRFKKRRIYPLSLQIEPTNACNLDCICCGRSRMSRSIGFMNINLFKKIIDNAANIGTKNIFLYLHGEPLLHPNIVDMIRYIKDSNLCFTISTNGMKLNQNISKYILESKVSCADYIRLSILGYSESIHEKIMKGVNSAQVKKNAQYFIKLRNQMQLNGPIIQAMFYRINENYCDEKYFSKYWSHVVDSLLLIRTISNHFSNISSNRQNYNRRLNDIFSMRYKTCKYIWDRMTIFWNGDVTSCMADVNGDHVFANMEKSYIQEVWNNPQLQRIRNAHLSKKFSHVPLCAACDW
jgi:radical SAM protein with 4Fe4S-binding SPASM domain